MRWKEDGQLTVNNQPMLEKKNTKCHTLVRHSDKLNAKLKDGLPFSPVTSPVRKIV